MAEKEFLDHIKDLLYNPTGEPGRGPFAHTQWGGVVKLPSQPRRSSSINRATRTGPRGLPDRRSSGGDRPAPKERTLLHPVEVRPEGLGFAMMDPLDKPDDLGTIKGSLVAGSPLGDES